jgi:hypothetical protein
MSSPSFSDQPVITNSPSLPNQSMMSNTPSLSSPSMIDPSQMQIRILQQQLTQLSQQNAATVQQMQEAANAAQSNMQTQIQNAQTTAQKSAQTTIWQNVSSYKLSEICDQVVLNSPNSITGNVTGKIAAQPIINFTDIGIKQMCASINTSSNVGSYPIPVSSSTIQTVRLTDNDKQVPYCNPGAISSSSYQTEQCVCNQTGVTPILHTATVKTGGVAGIGATTVTGYYCANN